MRAHAHRATLVFVLALAACSDPMSPSPLDAGTPDAGAIDGGVCTTCPPPDPCDGLACPDPRHTCRSESGSAECRCPAGTHAEGDRCVDDTACTPTSCGPGGTCTIEEGELRCECAEGYAGDRCESCASGYFPDGEGRCDGDPCDPSPCESADRQRCVVDPALGAQCLCNAGTHDEGGACVPDLTCGPETCAMRGTCTDGVEGPSCACDAGYAGPFCGECAEGHHPDGAGGCTTDPCLPDPCTAAPFTRCSASPEGATCGCEPGFHEASGTCVPDETCEPDTCSGRGACAVLDGRASCACEPGYAGDRCEGCEAGYHDDGAGGCTTDRCLPHPCTEPNRGVCRETASSHACDCDPGYHDDGVGGCTTDPCLPHPCGDQACRVDEGGAAECYTPVCDDGNPCTDDVFSGGACQHTPRADGSACSSTACISGQTCSAGECGGGSAVTCDDGDPCTRDSCDARTGCHHELDTALVPDDGVACTVDSCSTGTATHTPSDAACDDGSWCSGVERCMPASPSADARGCVVTSVPAPGPSSPCRYYGACDDATESFPLVELPAGASCDDGLACTSGDRCVSTGGACAGTVVPGCTADGGACEATTPWPDWTATALDVPSATLAGTITLDGAAPPATVNSAGYGVSTIWLVAQSTGVRHALGNLDYTYHVGGGTYRLQNGSGVIDARVVPGIYDVVYARGDSSGARGDRWISRVSASVPLPNGWKVLQRDVVVGPGANVLDVDVRSAALSGTITLDGAAPPATVNSAGYGISTVWAVAHDTGARHALGTLDYTYSVGSGTYRLQNGSGVVDARIPPGVYDILYTRGASTSDSGDRWVSRAGSSVALPNGWRVLRTGVTIAPGPSTLDVDVPTATVTGTITLDGAAPPATVNSAGYGISTVWAVAHDTGARHALGTLDYTYSVGSGTYRLQNGSGVVDARIPPGVYDILYGRGASSNDSGDRWVARVDSSVPLPNGWRILRTGVTIAPGASTLDVDVPTATVTGTITLDGAAPPATVNSAGYGSSAVWAVARDTGVRHALGTLDYTYHVGSGTYRLQNGSGVVDARIPPGVYDILYARGVSSNDSGDRWVARAGSSVPLPNGWRVLRTGVTIAPGPSTLDVDVPSVSLSAPITLDGAAPPATVNSAGYGSSALWAVARDTGVRHALGALDYTYSVGSGTYRLQNGSGVVDARIPPGVYDILYARGVSSSSTGDRWVSRASASVPLPNGWQLLEACIAAP